MSILPPAKQDNAARARRHALENRGQVDSFPQSVTITALERCNLACRMCDQGHGSDRMLPFQALERLAPALPFVQHVCLTGGEPLLYPGLEAFLELCFQYDCQTVIQTNGTLLTEARSRFLVERRVGTLKISVDGARPDTYNRIRVHGDFTRLMAHIRTLNRVKAALGSRRPALEFNFVAMRDNIRELPRLVQLAAAMGVDKVNVFSLLAHTEDMAGQSLFFEPALSDECTLAALEAARATGVRLNAPPLFGAGASPEGTRSDRFCTAPWDELTINVDGRAAICCGGAGSAGNLSTDDFHDLWNHPGRSAIRRTVNTPGEAACCRNCRLSKQDQNRIESHIQDPDLARRVLALRAGTLPAGTLGASPGRHPVPR